MILIDTDHATYLKYPESERGRRFTERLKRAGQSEVVGVAIVTVEERMRGWLAVIAKERTAIRQVAGYRELARLFEFYQEFEIVPFDEAAANKFDELRGQSVRIGTMDLKIAATALVHQALLLLANLRDFERVPGLRVANWQYRLLIVSRFRLSRSFTATHVGAVPAELRYAGSLRSWRRAGLSRPVTASTDAGSVGSGDAVGRLA